VQTVLERDCGERTQGYFFPVITPTYTEYTVDFFHKLEDAHKYSDQVADALEASRDAQQMQEQSKHIEDVVVGRMGITQDSMRAASKVKNAFLSGMDLTVALKTHLGNTVGTDEHKALANEIKDRSKAAQR